MKKVLSIILAVVMIITIVPVSAIMASAEVYTGTCGDKNESGNTVSWNYDSETGIMNIIGKGKMTEETTSDYVESGRLKIVIGSFSPAPALNKVIIGSQVTRISYYGLHIGYYNKNESSARGYKRLGIKEVLIGSSVNSIGDSAFSTLTDLEEIIIPSSCQTIERYAFYGCSALSALNLGNGLKTLGINSFSNCKKLMTPVMPASLVSIGNYCFQNCSSMTGDIVLYSKLASIGQDAFQGTNLDSITIYNSDCEIYENATTIPMKTKIIGHVGSTAQEYAAEFGNEFEAIAGETTEVVEPTCTEQGYTIHTCNDCGGTFIDTYTSALGHKEISAPAQAATCTEAGHEKGFVCSVCGAVLNGYEEIPVKGHTEIVTKESVAPTCTNTGLTEEISCSVCNEVLQEQVEIQALGHSYDEEVLQEPTCTEAGLKKLTCSVCDESHTEDIPALNHHYTNHVVAPTCTEAGYTRAICERCDYAFDFDFTDATGVHDYQAVVTTPATCTQKGIRTYTCSHCGDSFTEDIECIAHTVVTDNAVAATCTKTGLTSGTHCSRCGTVITERTETPATGHSYRSTVTAANCKDKGYTTYTCSKCGDSYKADYTNTTDSHVNKTVVTHQPSCTQKGISVTTCSVCGKSTTAEIAMTAHVTVVDKAVAPTCNKAGLTAGSHCAVCGYVIEEQEVISATGHSYNAVITEPSCKEQGYTTHTCTVCGDSYKDSFTNTTDGHDYIATITTPATCSKEGVRTYTCSICGDKYTKAIATIEHTPKTDAAVAPTCSKSGLAEGSHCAVCGYVIEEQAVVPATGHTYVEIVTAPTCKEQGYTTHTCSVCGDSYTSDFVATTDKHDYKATITTPATCSQQGVKTFTCTVCGDKYTESIAMIDHTPSVDKSVAPTCTSSGLAEGSHCAVCGYVITEQAVVPATGHTYGEVVTAPTCKEQGYTTHTCSVCGDSYKSDFTATIDKHDYKATITTPATCSQQGVKTFTCSICGDKYTESIEMTEHTPAVDKAVATTCTKAGLTEGSHCAVCGYVITEQSVVPAIDHSYNASITKEASCSQAGVKTYTCSACGEKYYEAIPVIAHTPVTDNAVAPTCTKAGLTAGTHCSVCGKILTAQTAVAAIGHNYTSIVTTESTCAQAGVKTFTCTDCGDNYTQSLELKEHTIVIDEAVAPTCTKYGLTEGKSCYVCGKVFELQEKVEPLGHDFGTVVTPATLTANGVITHPCSRCDKAADSEVIAMPKTFALAKTSYVYSGKAITPAVTVKDVNGNVLKNSIDYSVAYSANKAVGTAKVVITFTGNYSGTKTLTFTILPKGTNLVLAAAKKAFTAKWTKVSGVTGYQIQYSTNAKFTGAKTLTIKGASKYTTAIKNLKASGKYYVRIRTYQTVGGKNYCSAWSAAKTVTTKK